jgi:hypothetical protein
MQHIQEFCGERKLSDVNLNLKIKAAYMGEVHYPAMQDRLPAKLCKITGLKRKHLEQLYLIPHFVSCVWILTQGH